MKCSLDTCHPTRLGFMSGCKENHSQTEMIISLRVLIASVSDSSQFFPKLIQHLSFG